MTVKTIIDVETLLRWTYQVQRADVIIGAGVGLYEGEALADGVGGGGSMDSITRLRRAAILGVKVDGGGFGSGALHPDAEAVHGAVTRLIADDRGAGLLVQEFAIAGLRPDWREGARPRWEPCHSRQKPNGEWTPIYQYNAKAGIGNRPWFCPLRLVDHPESIAFARRSYDTWRFGLVILAGVFQANRSRLCAYIVTGPRVAATPWKAQETTA